MNFAESVVHIWPEPLEDPSKSLKLEEFESKMGGRPLWLRYGSQEESPDLKCGKCGLPLKFLMQLSCPVDKEPQGYYRYLYVFICMNKKSCTNTQDGITVLRSQLPKDNEYFKELEQEGEGDSPILEYIKPYQDLISGEECILFEEEKVMLDEVITKDKQKQMVKIVDEGIQEQDLNVSEDDLGFAEYSKACEYFDDPVVQYCFHGLTKPLYYSSYDQFEPTKVPKCQLCGAKRWLEFQINNTILQEHSDLLDLDWGIIAVYSCSKSCKINQGYVREHVELQLSPDEIDKAKFANKQARIIEEFERDLAEDENEAEQKGQGDFREEMSEKETPNPQQQKQFKGPTKEELISKQKRNIFQDSNQNDGDDSDDDWSQSPIISIQILDINLAPKTHQLIQQYSGSLLKEWKENCLNSQISRDTIILKKTLKQIMIKRIFELGCDLIDDACCSKKKDEVIIYSSLHFEKENFDPNLPSPLKKLRSGEGISLDDYKSCVYQNRGFPKRTEELPYIDEENNFTKFQSKIFSQKLNGKECPSKIDISTQNVNLNINLPQNHSTTDINITNLISNSNDEVCYPLREIKISEKNIHLEKSRNIGNRPEFDKENSFKFSEKLLKSIENIRIKLKSTNYQDKSEAVSLLKIMISQDIESIFEEDSLNLMESEGENSEIIFSDQNFQDTSLTQSNKMGNEDVENLILLNKILYYHENTLYLAISIFKKLAKIINISALQNPENTTGIFCLFIAAKMTEGDPVSAKKLIDIFQLSISLKSFLKTEVKILKKLNFDLVENLQVDYIDLLSVIFGLKLHEYILFSFFSEISLYDLADCIPASPLQTAAGCLMLALTLNPKHSLLGIQVSNLICTSCQNIIFQEANIASKVEAYLFNVHGLKETYLKYSDYISYCEFYLQKPSLLRAILGARKQRVSQSGNVKINQQKLLNFNKVSHTMPTITVNLKYLWTLLGQEMSEHDFEQLCFDYGLEAEFYEPPKAGEQGSGEISEGDAKVETPANRYDLLSVEGLALALGIFLGKQEIPQMTAVAPESMLEMFIEESVLEFRPFALGAVIRNVTFTEESYNSFIDLQDKLHQNLGRKRTLMSMGTHDLDTIKAPFYFRAQNPSDIKFVPLKQTKEMNGVELFDFLRVDPNMKLKPYLHIIEDFPQYPVIYDSEGVVLSLPPIINSEHSKITIDTKNIFFDITGTDATKVTTALKLIVGAFSRYSATPFTFEQVKIVPLKEGQEPFVTPVFDTFNMKAGVKYMNDLIGINLEHEEIAKNLTKMGLTTVSSNETEVEVSVPYFRSDVLHPCDIAEDLGIAYGFDNIQEILPPVQTSGTQQPLNQMTDLIRIEMCSAGYKECLNFALCSVDENTLALNQTDTSKIVTIQNPKTAYFQSGRISLIPGLMKTLSKNKTSKLPIELFEVTDVILRTDENTIGAKNERRLGAIRTNTDSAELSNTHGLLDFVMTKFNIPLNPKIGYTIRQGSSDTYLANLQAEVLYKGEVIGSFGILHPKILEMFSWTFPVSALEINIEPLIKGFLEQQNAQN